MQRVGNAERGARELHEPAREARVLVVVIGIDERASVDVTPQVATVQVVPVALRIPALCGMPLVSFLVVDLRIERYHSHPFTRFERLQVAEEKRRRTIDLDEGIGG